MLKPGQAIDRYTVDVVLGQGGMAVVYRVKHNQLGSYHALKVLTLSTPGIKERMLQEGRVQAQLRHPNIVTVTDVIEVEGSPGLVMEYIDGPGLDSWLGDNQLDVKQAEHLFRSIVSAVAFAHDQGVVHRDLKPANVMLANASGGGFIPKVCDFGLAKALAAAADSGMQATRSGVTMGTPAYMAPEQIRDAKNVDHRADVFSLGCILYELICGRPPFVGPDILSIFNAVASGSYPPPISLIPDLPARVQNAIQGALVVDRDRRVPDCHVLLRVLDGEPFGYTLSGAGATIAPAGPTLTGSMVASATSEQSPTASGGLQQVEREPAPRAPSASDPGLDGSIVPKSIPDDATMSVPPRRRLWLLPVVVLPLAIAAVLALVVAGGTLFMAKRWERNLRTTIGEHTGGEVTWAGAAVRPRAVVLRDVTVLASDGEPFATADSVALQGRWKVPAMRFQASALRIDGLKVDARRARDGWFVPGETASLLRGEKTSRALSITLDVSSGPARFVLATPSGTVDAAVEELALSGLTLDLADPRLWTAAGFEITGLDARAGDPVLSAGRVSLADDDGGLVVEDLDVWLRIREDGLVDAPPVLAEELPDWLGGQSHVAGDDPWFAVHAGWWPRAPERLDVRSGNVHVLDRAHAMKTVQWDVAIDRIGVGPRGDGWVPLDIAGRVGASVITISGDARRDGLVRGRFSVRRMPLARLAPYLEHSLRHYQVDPGTGEVSTDVDFTMKADSFGARMEAEAEAVTFTRAARPEGVPDAPWSSKRLLDTYRVQSGEQVLGSLADPGFEPVDDMLHALAEALFKPAGGAVWPTRTVVQPAPAPTPRPVTRPRPKPEPTKMTRTPPEPEPEAAPEDAPGTGDDEARDAPTREVNKFGREVREALEDLKIPGDRRRRRGDD